MRCTSFVSLRAFFASVLAIQKFIVDRPGKRSLKWIASAKERPRNDSKNETRIRHVYVMLIFSSLVASGCAKIIEVPKVLWGSSTKALDEARPKAWAQVFPCNLELCFEDVLEIANKENLDVYRSDRKKWLIVLMGFKESIDTTEVGFYLTPVGSTQTKIEIVSLSDAAQDTAVKLFAHTVGNKDEINKLPEVVEPKPIK